VDPDDGLEVRGLVVQYPGNRHPVVSDVSFIVAPARTLSVVGPSGAGKSTLLRAICGLVPITRGEVSIGGRSVVSKRPQERRAAMVFASDALARTMTIRENLRFVLRSSDESGRIEDVARALDVHVHLDKYPQQLSTGERQRVSIARAVLSDPAVLLLDEPLAPLDPDLRVRVRDEIVHVRERFGGPIVFVTHDHTDAMAVADDLVVMMDGRIEDSGDPQSVFDRPASARVAAFLGARPMNLLPGTAFGWPGTLVAGFRPERARLTSGADAVLGGSVERVERTGADVYVHVRTQYGVVIVRTAAPHAPAIGSDFGIAVAEEDLCRYDDYNP
jgi:ABC-type sugar transport system ATPase subunit